MGVRKSHHQFSVELNAKHPNLELLGQYVSATSKVKLRCNIDGYEWFARPANLLSGHGCPKCAGNLNKTHEQFLKELSVVNKHIKVLGEYRSAKSQIKVKCLLDDHEWYGTPDNFLRGRGCPVCAVKSMTKDHIEFVEEIASINPNIEILSEYVRYKTKIKVRCRIDGTQWEAHPGVLLRGSGCQTCDIRNRSKTHESYVSELKLINANIVVLTEYVKNADKILVRCLVDGYEWFANPHNLLKGCGCPKCARYGYDPSKESYFYIYFFGKYVGFGITNSIKVRHKRHLATFDQLNIPVELVKVFKGCGRVIKAFEAHLKKTLPIANSGIEGFKTEAILYQDRDLLFRAVKVLEINNNLTPC